MNEEAEIESRRRIIVETILSIVLVFVVIFSLVNLFI